MSKHSPAVYLTGQPLLRAAGADEKQAGKRATAAPSKRVATQPAVRLNGEPLIAASAEGTPEKAASKPAKRARKTAAGKDS